MSKPKYNIVTIDINDYLKYHWKRTEEARRKVAINAIEWRMIWTKNYWVEYAAELEEELTRVKARLVEVLKEKLDDM